jgi:hypothetical protein
VHKNDADDRPSQEYVNMNKAILATAFLVSVATSTVTPVRSAENANAKKIEFLLLI